MVNGNIKTIFGVFLKAGTKVGPDQLGSEKKNIKIKWNWNFYPFEG